MKDTDTDEPFYFSSSYYIFHDDLNNIFLNQSSAGVSLQWVLGTAVRM